MERQDSPTPNGTLLQIRKLVQPNHADLPAPWERARPVQAIGLALETAGFAFSVLDDNELCAS